MSLRPDQITIAITVYNRRQFIKQAVASALNQTIPVRVIVVEDCGPDPELEAFVKSEFGSRISYFRNPARRGLFDNWNSCLDLCGTEWLSILHDDDYLAPSFIEKMMELNSAIPGCSLYFGHTLVVNEEGSPMQRHQLPQPTTPSRKIGLEDALFITPFPFPGQLFRVADARAVGGFRPTSLFCGDWEMWVKLICHSGAAQTSSLVAYNRSHEGFERGTSKVVRTGRLIPLMHVQHKRNYALLRQQGHDARFNRIEIQKKGPVPLRFLLAFAHELPPRILAYHVRLFLLSTPPHLGYRLFQWITAVFGSKVPVLAARAWNWRKGKAS